MKRYSFINFKNSEVNKRIVYNVFTVPALLFVFLLPFVLTACEKDVIEPNIPTINKTRNDSTDTTASGGNGSTILKIDTTWADTIHINWDSLGTDSTNTDTTKIDVNTDMSEEDAGGAASRRMIFPF